MHLAEEEEGSVEKSYCKTSSFTFNKICDRVDYVRFCSFSSS
jgi:hypothetical protein